MNDLADTSSFAERQPPVLRSLLRHVELALKQYGLYGAEHPRAGESIDLLSQALDEFLRFFERPECIFRGSAVSIGERSFEPSPDSEAIHQRLLARGAMSMTFVSSPPHKELASLLKLMNFEPADIREAGGMSACAKAWGIHKVQIGEVPSVNLNGMARSSGQTETSCCESGEVMDVLADWLSGESVDDGAPYDLPVDEVLSDPGVVVSLLQRAVSRMQETGASDGTEQATSQVMERLTQLVSLRSEEWNKAVKDIRKAISKLPGQMQFALTIFGGSRNYDSSRAISVDQMEDASERIVQRIRESKGRDRAIPSELEGLFGAQTKGMLSDWRDGVSSSASLISSGKTLGTLLLHEENEGDHKRMAGALAVLIRRAVEDEEMEAALTLTESLVTDATSDHHLAWRAETSKNTLCSLDPELLNRLVKSALQKGDLRARVLAASVVALVPGLALSLSSLLGAYPGDPFNQALKSGIAGCGRDSLNVLESTLRHGSFAAKSAALEAFLEMNDSGAIQRMGTVAATVEPGLAIKALNMLNVSRPPGSVAAALAVLTHESEEVRCGALRLLGELGDCRAVEKIVSAAAKPSFGFRVSDQRIEAIRALGRIGGHEAVHCLENLVRTRAAVPLPSSRKVRNTAKEALKEALRSGGSEERKAA